MSRRDIHHAPVRADIEKNKAVEPEGERIRAELEDFLDRNKIVTMMLDTQEHVIDIGHRQAAAAHQAGAETLGFDLRERRRRGRHAISNQSEQKHRAASLHEALQDGELD